MAGRYGITPINGGGVVGLPELLAKLRVLPQTASVGCAMGMQEATAAIREQAKMRAPGEIAPNIDSTVELDGLLTRGTVFVEPGGGTNKPAEWPTFVEMGTGPRGIASGGDKYPLPGSAYTQQPWIYHDETGFHRTSGRYAEPYLWPAYQQEKPYIVERIAAHLTIDQEGTL